MRRAGTAPAFSWTILLAATLAIGAIGVEPAIADQKTYTSVRDCMRSVAKAESELNEAGEKAANLFNRARDLCMQTRYDQVRKSLNKVQDTSDAQ
ncbi:hypothetical protein HW532_00295 [Kaustia mangrovi]|uniref:Uncharacterized protein n=1 Tax=Kaustia mangrovi TaxID=2593653 RepID=A0A7S8C0Y2_9HYPH|nr:hypothetical protein [Kaustia mangrovi]QPC41316.1 hypothetical protein HW532_00295 [Kaustia mangrovi]